MEILELAERLILHLSIFYLLIAGLLEGLHTIDGFTREA